MEVLLEMVIPSDPGRVRISSLSSSDLCLNSIGFNGCDGGLFREDSAPRSFVSLIGNQKLCSSENRRRGIGFEVRGGTGGRFLSVTVSINGGGNEGFEEDSGEKAAEGEMPLCRRQVEKVEEEKKVRSGGEAALNTTKHLWAGAVAAAVSRYKKKSTFSVLNWFLISIFLLVYKHICFLVLE